MIKFKNIYKNVAFNIKNSVFSILLIIILAGCTENFDKYDKFANTYYQVLIAREIYEDSLVQATEVKKILQKNGYNEQQFAEETMRIFTEDQKVLTMIVDSLRKKVIRDTDSLQKQKMKDLIKKAADSTANAQNERK